MSMWLVPLSRILNAQGLGRLAPYGYATFALAAFVSPLIFGAMADRHTSPSKVMRWLATVSGLTLIPTTLSIQYGWSALTVLLLLQIYAITATPTTSLASTIVFSPGFGRSKALFDSSTPPDVNSSVLIRSIPSLTVTVSETAPTSSRRSTCSRVPIGSTSSLRIAFIESRGLHHHLVVTAYQECRLVESRIVGLQLGGHIRVGIGDHDSRSRHGRRLRIRHVPEDRSARLL